MTKKEIEQLEEIQGLTDIEKNMLKKQKNGLLLTDKQVSVLDKYNINHNSCKSDSELLYMIDSCIEGYEEDEYADLEAVADSIQERNYYKNTRK